MSAEAALSLEPTVVFAQTDTGPPEALEQIRDAGVPVVVLDEPGSIDDISPRIRTVAAALGVPDAGEALVARTEAEIATAQEAIPEGDTPDRGLPLPPRVRPACTCSVGPARAPTP